MKEMSTNPNGRGSNLTTQDTADFVVVLLYKVRVWGRGFTQFSTATAKWEFELVILCLQTEGWGGGGYLPIFQPPPNGSCHLCLLHSPKANRPLDLLVPPVWPIGDPKR